jgi:hypothetical protein
MTTRANGQSVMFLHGGGKRNCSFYNPLSNELTASETTWQTVEDGAAIAQIDNVCYAECGYESERDGIFYGWYDWPPGDGPQGRSLPATMMSVSVRLRSSTRRFTVRGANGPVSLRVFNAAGQVVAGSSALSRAGTAELEWSHYSTPAGVYVYAVTTAAGTASGKFVLVR